jgi:hypothetical protein
VHDRLYFSIAIELIELATAEPPRRVSAATPEPIYRETQEGDSFLFLRDLKCGISLQLTKDEQSEIFLDNY